MFLLVHMTREELTVGVEVDTSHSIHPTVYLLLSGGEKKKRVLKPESLRESNKFGVCLEFEQHKLDCFHQLSQDACVNPLSCYITLQEQLVIMLSMDQPVGQRRSCFYLSMKKISDALKDALYGIAFFLSRMKAAEEGWRTGKKKQTYT